MLAPLFAVFALTLVLGIPVGIGLGVSALAAIVISGFPPTVAITRMFSSVDSVSLLAIPFFILAGELMNTGGMTMRLVNLANALVGHWRGGLGQVNVVTSVIFAGMQGSATADVSAEGSVIIPAMAKAGWRKATAVAITATSSIIGPLIPPSLMMILYGVIANVSITRLFYAGIVPGLLTAAALMITVALVCGDEGAGSRFSRSRVWSSLREAWLAMLMPVLVLGGLRLGAFTPTEGGAVAAVYAFVVGKWVYRTINWSDLPRIFRNAAMTTAAAGLMLSTAGLFGWVLSWEGFPALVNEWISGMTNSPVVFLLLVVTVTMFIGLFFEGIPYLLVFTPIVLPTARALGLDLVHFGVVLVVAVMIGSVTPPVGILTYLACKIAGIGIAEATPRLLPFIGALIVVVYLLALFPSLVVAVPNWLLGS